MPLSQNKILVQYLKDLKKVEKAPGGILPKMKETSLLLDEGQTTDFKID